MDINQIRAKIPELEGLDDQQVVDVLHQAYYPDMTPEAIGKALGVKPPAPPPAERTLMGTAGDFGISLLKGAIAVPEAAVGLADVATGGRVGEFLENKDGMVGFRPKEAKAALDDMKSEAQKQADRNFQEAEGFGGKFSAALQNPSVIGHAVVESLPAMGAGGVVARGLGAAAPGVSALVRGAVGEGVVGAGSAAEQVRQQTGDGLLTGEQAGLAALTGVGTTAFGLIGAKVAKSLGIADVDTMLAGASANPAKAKGVTRRVLEGAVAEGALEELPQSVQEQVLQNKALGRPLDEGVDEAVVLGLLSGMAMGGGAQLLSGQHPPAANDPSDTAVAPANDPGPALALPAPVVTVGPDGTAMTADQRTAEREARGGIVERGPLSRAVNTAMPAANDVIDVEARTVMPGEGVLDEGASAQAPADAGGQPLGGEGGAQLLDAGAPAGRESQPAAEVAPGVLGEEAPVAPDQAGERSAGDVAPGIFATYEEADAYRKEQKARGGSIQALPVPDDDGFALATKDSPRYAEGEALRAERELARKRTEAGVLDGDITNKKGMPFTIRLPANNAAKAAGPGHEVVQVNGGFVVRKTGDVNVSVRGETEPVAGRSDDGGSTDAVGGVGAALGRDGEPGPAGAPGEHSVAAATDAVRLDPAGGDVAAVAEDVAPAPQIVEHTTGKGKVLRGVVRTDLDQDGAKAIDPYTFKKDGGWFIREKHLGAAPTEAEPEQAIDSAAHEAATSQQNDLPEPTQAQKEAGNYKLGHLSGDPVQGLRISIENPKGSERRGTSPDGTSWANTMGAHYGYVKGSEAADGDQVDIFVGPAADRAPTVWVIDQVNADGTYDEAKALFGFMNKAAGVRAYKASYSKDWKVGPITEMSVEEFKQGLADGRFKKPLDPSLSTTPTKASEELPAGPVVIPADAKVFEEALGDLLQADLFGDDDSYDPEHSQYYGERDRDRAMFNDPTPAVALPRLTSARPSSAELPFISTEEAASRLAEWKAEAERQGREHLSANASRTVISLFDASGVITQPWVDAGYNVISYDLAVDGEFGDVSKFDAEMLLDRHGNDEVWAVLAQPPCTDFAASGAQWWKAKDADGRTEASNELVRQTLRTIELFRPAVWVMENPTGRIASLNKLPEPKLAFDPWAYGNPYTKRTQLWGRFNPNLPTAPVEPTEGSKIHKLSSSAKYERSLTPEGFAYALFMANNAESMDLGARLAQEFAGVDVALFRAAVDAGHDEHAIRNAIVDSYYDQDLEYVREELGRLAGGPTKPPAAPEPPVMSRRNPAPATAEDAAGLARYLDRLVAQGYREPATGISNGVTYEFDAAPFVKTGEVMIDGLRVMRYGDAWKQAQRAGESSKPEATPAAKGEPATDTEPATAKPKVKRESKADREAREAEEARAEYFTPGNVVRSYGGFDRVIDYRAPDETGRWSVTVQQVEQDGDGRWVDSERSLERTHSTQPSPSELKNGPRAKIKEPVLNSEAKLSAERRAAMAATKPDVAPTESDAAGAEPATDDGDEPVAAKGSAAKITDAGEKIGGARKDRWKDRGMDESDLDSIAESEAAELVTKAAVWKPDWAKLVADGMNPAMAATAKIVLDRLAAKPKDNTPDGRRRYVKMMQAVRHVYGSLTPENVATAKNRLLYDSLQWTLGRSPETAALASRNAKGIEDLGAHMDEQRKVLFSVYKGRSDPFSFDSMDLLKVKDMIAEGFPAKAEPWTNRFTTRERSTRGLTPRGRELLLEQAQALGTPLTMEQIEGEGQEGSYWEVRQKATGKVVAYALNQAQADEQGRAAYAKTLARTVGGQKENPPDRPHLDKLERTALPDRLDRDASPQDFIDDFGFRGVEFGNWAAQDERQRVINMAYDGLADLAEIMGVPKEAMSLNGTMGLAFGARGGGRFAAHYEPGRLVINMTKLRGGGSMAHEWAHAFDHYMGELDLPDAYKTGARGASGWHTEERYDGMPRKRMEKDAAGKWTNVERKRLENLRPELARAFDQVMSALFSKQVSKAEKVRDAELRVERSQARAAVEEDPRIKSVYEEGVKAAQDELEHLRGLPDDTTFEGGASAYRAEAQKLNGEKADGYWTRPTEMFARAFESWVFDRLRAMGAKSDYLVHGVEDGRYASERYKGNPYPAGAERTAINEAFDKLADTIQTRDGNGGRATMFSVNSEAMRTSDSAGDALATSQASAEHRTAAGDLLARLRKSHWQVPPFHAVDLGEGIEPAKAKHLAAVRTVAQRMFGHDVVFVRFDGPQLFNGVVSKAMPGKVFINIDSAKPHMAVLGHELLHQLQATAPGLYDALSRRLFRLVSTPTKFYDKIEASYREQGLEVPENWDEEMIADVVGDNFMDATFWQALAAEKPTLFRRVANAIIKFLDDVKALLSGGKNPFGTDEFVDDVDAARAAVVDAMREFSAGRVGKHGVASGSEEARAPSTKVRIQSPYLVQPAHGQEGSVSAPTEGVSMSAAESALAELSKADDLYALPRATATTLEGIAAELDPALKVKMLSRTGVRSDYNVTLPDGNTARIVVRDANPYGPSVYGFNQKDGNVDVTSTERPGANPDDVPSDKGDVWLDVSLLEQGGRGDMVYALAAGFAHNTGRIFIGDPAGLSDAAMRRRLEQMISSALKYGTTEHLAPGIQQIQGGNGVPPLHWVYGDHVGNIERMIAASVKAMDNAFPGSNVIAFYPDNGSFFDTRTGSVLRRGMLAGAVSRIIGDSRALPRSVAGEGEAGWRTVARAAVFRALALGQGEGSRGADGRSPGLLDRLRAAQPDLGAEDFRDRIFYSLASGGAGARDSGDRRAGQGGVEGQGAARASDRLNDPRAWRAKAEDALGDLFNSPGVVGWWHKTVGTMHNLAQRSPRFKRVYDAVQTFLNDVSYYATEAADLAPRILPKLERLADLKKTALSAEDTKALSRPVFEGTLMWARDEDGKLVKAAELEERFADLSTEDKAHMLLRKRRVTPEQLRRWQASKLDVYDGAVRNRFDAEFVQAGVVFTDAELRAEFGLNDEQIGLYREFRAAIDKSLNTLGTSEMLRFAGKDAVGIRDMVLDAGAARDAAKVLQDFLMAAADDDPGRRQVLIDTADTIVEKGERIQHLIDHGYAPLSRYGQYTLDVVDADGNRLYFGMFENRLERGAMARRMAANHPGAQITQGTVSEQAYKLFNGITPETLELFGEMVGIEADGDDPRSQLFQEYLKLAKSNRSAMKRLIHRKGIAGFSEDAGRVLAGFVYSNARLSATNLHQGEISQAVNDIPKEDGQLKDVAVKLSDYVRNPQEEAQAIRGLLFAHYIGGSIASALVNMTQPFTVTMPYLSQFGGIAKSAARMKQATADVAKGGTTGDAKLDAALKHAEAEGIVAPQEVHQLMAQARGRAALQSGDGTVAGNARAMASNAASKLSVLWGKPFSLAEQFNRRITFIAAYRTAVAEGIADPAKFAEKAIAETQFVYNKGNKPQWARGAVGGIVFTFKQYSISYVELLHRMAMAGKPGSPERAAGRRAALFALGMLLLVGGAGGVPFAEDVEDLVDGVMQRLGYSFQTKQARRAFFARIVGQGGAEFLERGLSGLPGVPLDVSGRLGMGDLIPSTGLLVKKEDHARDVAELAGPAGDLVQRAYQGVGLILDGKPVQGATMMSPKASENMRKGLEMMIDGQYRDTKGRRVMDATALEGIIKAIGFQPGAMALESERAFAAQRAVGQNRMVKSDFQADMAQAVFDRDGLAQAKVRAAVRRWNERNPESPVKLDMAAVQRRVRNMRMDRAQRLEKAAPKAIREDVRRQLTEGDK